MAKIDLDKMINPIDMQIQRALKSQNLLKKKDSH